MEHAWIIYKAEISIIVDCGHVTAGKARRRCWGESNHHLIELVNSPGQVHTECV